MFGAWIGDLAGNGCLNDSPNSSGPFLFSENSHLTDAGIMTAVVANAIMQSRKEQFNREKDARPFSFFFEQETIMQRQADSKGIASALYVTPCGIAAVALEEAIFLARICAGTANGDDDAVKQAEAVAGAVYLAKRGRSKGEIHSFLKDYCFDPKSNSGVVAMAFDCFMKSSDFIGALQSALRISAPSRRSVATITSALAWSFYCAMDVNEEPNEAMRQISTEAKRFIPANLREIDSNFHAVAQQRAGTFNRSGFCTRIMNEDEEHFNWHMEQVKKKRELRTIPDEFTLSSDIPKKDLPPITPAEKNDSVSAIKAIKHLGVVEAVSFLEDNRSLFFVREVYPVKLGRRGITLLRVALEKTPEEGQPVQQDKEYTIEKIIELLKTSWAFQTNDFVLWEEITPERFELSFNLTYVHAFHEPYPIRTIWEARELPKDAGERHIGNKRVYYDKSMGKTCMVIQLDKDWLWFLSIFYKSTTGKLLKYCLDCEAASDSHYEFKDEASVRKAVYQEGDEGKYLDEIFIRFVGTHSGYVLLQTIQPFITAQFHYD